MGVVPIIKNKAMAIVKYGTIITEIRGKVNSHVFQKCGQSLSMRSSNTNRSSLAASANTSRINFTRLGTRWRSMTQTQKDSFTNNAASYPTFNKYGDPIILTGYQLFQLINKRLKLVTSTPITTGTSYNPPATSDIDFNPFSIAGTSFTLLWNTAIAANTAVILYVSNPVSGSRYITNPKYHFCVVIHSGTAIGTNYYSTVLASFSNVPLVGYSFYWQAWKIDLLTGQSIIDNGAQELILS